MVKRVKLFFPRLFLCVLLVYYHLTFGTSTVYNKNCICDNYGTDVYCHCTGKHVKDIPSDMPSNTTKM